MTLLTLLIACGGGNTPVEAEVVETPPAPAAEPVAIAPSPEAAEAPEAPAAAAAGGAANTEAGGKVYVQYCQACHQADGTGMGGMLAADLVNDKTRLAKSDEVLLASIRDGVSTGTTPMPPWGATLSEQEMVDVLAYMRATYGG